MSAGQWNSSMIDSEDVKDKLIIFIYDSIPPEIDNSVKLSKDIFGRCN